MNNTDTKTQKGDFWKAMNAVRQYAYDNDSKGYECLCDNLHDAGNDAEVKEVLALAVRSYFEAMVENSNPDSIADIDDKRGAIDRLDRACHFSNEAFALTLSEVMAYALQDIHPEA